MAIVETAVTGNQALGGQGGQGSMSGGVGGDAEGGGLLVGTSSTGVAIERSTDANNLAVGGPGGGPGGSDGQGVGGSIYNANGLVSLRMSAVQDNRASTSDDDLFGPFVEDS